MADTTSSENKKYLIITADNSVYEYDINGFAGALNVHNTKIGYVKNINIEGPFWEEINSILSEKLAADEKALTSTGSEKEAQITKLRLEMNQRRIKLMNCLYRNNTDKIKRVIYDYTRIWPEDPTTEDSDEGSTEGTDS